MTTRHDFTTDKPRNLYQILVDKTVFFLETSNRDLAYVTAEEAYDTIETCRHLQHDHVVFLECRRLGVGYRDESFNKVCDFAEIYPPSIPVPPMYRNQTPDILYFDTSNKLHVRDITITTSDPERARDAKIMKYAYFADLYPGAKIEATVLKRTEKSVRAYLDNFRISDEDYLIRLQNRYTFFITQAEKNPDFPVIQSMLNSTKIPLDKFEHFEPDFSTVPIPLIENLFGSTKYFNDFLKLTGPFKGFAEDSEEDLLWLDTLSTHVNKIVAKTEAETDHFTSLARFKKAVETFLKDFTAMVKGRERPPIIEFYKIIPVPFVRLVKSHDPRSAVEDFIHCYTPQGHKLLDTMMSSMKISLGFSEVLPYFRGQVHSETYKEDFKALIKSQEPLYRSCGSRIVNRRTFQMNFRSLGVHEDLVKLTGIDLLKESGKTIEKQMDTDTAFTLDHDMTVLEQLRDWMIKDTGDTDSMLVNPSFDGAFGFSKDLLQELKVDLNMLIAEKGGANVFKLADFYTKLYTEISFMGEQNMRSNNVCVSSLGSTNILVILHGGGPLGRPTTRRKFWLVFEDYNDFPLRSTNRTVLGSRFKIMMPINVDSLTAAHHLMTKKFVWDQCFGCLLDSSKSLDCFEDRVDVFFTRVIARFNNTKPINILLMNVRYAALACSAFYCSIEKLLSKMLVLPRNVLNVYFINNILQAILDFYDSDSGRSHVFKSDLSQDPEDNSIRTVVRSPRFLGPGYHDSANGIIDEAYYYCGVSKEIRSRYHSRAVS